MPPDTVPYLPGLPGQTARESCIALPDGPLIRADRQVLRGPAITGNGTAVRKPHSDWKDR